MKLVRYNPFNEINLWNNFFNDSFFNTREKENWTPAVDIVDRNDTILINIEVPGVQKDDFNVSIVDKVLTISGQRKFEKSEGKDTYYRKERIYGSFKRSFSLSDDIITDEICADYKAGILTITLKKNTTKEKIKQITVN